MAGTFDRNPANGIGDLAVNKITLSWTSAANGSATVVSDKVRGTILRITTNPGSAAPTDNYDATLTDEEGVDVAMGLLANRDTANSESVYPVDTVSGLPIAVCDALTLAITNAGDSKTGSVVVYFR